MDTVLQFLNTRLLVVVMVAVAAFLFSGGLMTFLSWVGSPARRRLGALSGAVPTETTLAWAATISAAVRPFARYVMPTSNKELGTMQERLVRAGFQSPDAMPIF